MTTVEIGTIKINNPKVENFIKQRNNKEIKKILIELLLEKVQETHKRKSKWANFADKMSGLTNSDISKHIKKTGTEMRENFQIRNLDIN